MDDATWWPLVFKHSDARFCTRAIVHLRVGRFHVWRKDNGQFFVDSAYQITSMDSGFVRHCDDLLEVRCLLLDLAAKGGP